LDCIALFQLAIALFLVEFVGGDLSLLGDPEFEREAHHGKHYTCPHLFVCLQLLTQDDLEAEGGVELSHHFLLGGDELDSLVCKCVRIPEEKPDN